MTKIYIHTQGCAVNKADSEIMAGLLEANGFKIVESGEDADIVILNTCTVKGPSETAFKKNLSYYENLHKKIIIGGCVTQADPKLGRNHSIIGVDQVDHIVEVVEELLNDNIVRLLVKEPAQKLNLPKKRTNKVIEIIPISQGCLGDPCSYCKVKQARGNLYSYPREQILNHARRAVENNAKELWITAQDTGCYGHDNSDNYFLPDLIKDLAAIKGDFMIRVGMANPEHIITHLDALIEAFSSPKVFKFIHVPVQSGNNEVLRRMRRHYDVGQFRNLVAKFRQAYPAINISTDIICGFPGETDAQFNDSIKLIEEIKPDELNVSRYWPRPGTEAACFEQLPGDIIKNRSRRLSSLFDYISFERNKLWRGWEGYVVIDEFGKDNSFIARNYAYKPVIVRGNYKLGDKLKVKIAHTTIYDLRAEVV